MPIMVVVMTGRFGKSLYKLFGLFGLQIGFAVFAVISCFAVSKSFVNKHMCNPCFSSNSNVQDV